MEQPLLDVRNLRTTFDTYEGQVRAVDGVSYHLDRGEVLGLVGESGCGKSVSSLSIMRLIPSPPGRIEADGILFKGRNLLDLSASQMRRIRGNQISMIFQEPMTSLSPVFTIGEQIAEVYRQHRNMGKAEAMAKSVDMLCRVNMPDPGNMIRRYPHELSGGMRQRVMIAMSLACNPDILFADESTTALDVTIQAQILDLMLRLKDEFGMSVVLVTHDLGVVAYATTRVVVMYVGRVVEEAPTGELFKNPRHPYTQGLIKSVPKIGAKALGKQRLHEITGVVPSLHNLPQGCKFHERCPQAMDVCRAEEPGFFQIGPGHVSRCWLNEKERVA